ncbi:hypothetical protein L1887_41842 [Cichorium endivia]|nr:hypothetical protein L1887_41842 [Cichorium endivia]
MAPRDDSLQSISTQLDGKNYAYWSYVMKNFLRGKNMWGIVTGTKGKPRAGVEGYATLLESWETDNSKIITWINNFVVQSIGTQLTNYDTTKELEFDIRALQQNSLSIQEFYASISDLWDRLALTEPAELKAFKPYIDRREEQRLVQFLMALRSDFEGLRGSILHSTPLPTVDSLVHELIAEETRIKSQADKGPKTAVTPAVFDVPQRPQTSNQNRPRVAFDECAFCKKKNHWKSRCPLLLTSTTEQAFWTVSVTSTFFPFRPPQYVAAAAEPSVETAANFTPPSALDPQIVEQFRQFIAANPNALSASTSHSGLSSSDPSDCYIFFPFIRSTDVRLIVEIRPPHRKHLHTNLA